jgi:hypothetical protein
MTLLSVSMIVASLVCAAVAGDNHGVVELDATSFKKIVGGPLNVLLALTEYSWKAPDNYNDVADHFKETGNVLVAKLDVSALDAAHPLKVGKLPTLRFYAAGASPDAFVEHTGASDVAADVVQFVDFQLSPKVSFHFLRWRWA